MLAGMTSHELTEWQAFFLVRNEEAEYRQHVAESGDGKVYIQGRDEDLDDDGDDE